MAVNRTRHSYSRLAACPALISLVFFGQILLFSLTAPADETPAPVDYVRDVRPILSDKCYFCHGPDASHREADLRLDRKESALGEAESGEVPVVPGQPELSELIRRITSDDEDEQMPPPDSGKSLNAEEIDKLRGWISAGAPWQEHWSFVPVKQPATPKVNNDRWPRNAIDRFILSRLERDGLSPSAEAGRVTLVRRVTFDLTGLPPTPAEVDAFVQDNAPGAYERLVDRLLESPRYGEHMARFWLDAARYGDTHGLHLDNYREMWPYRDWVVRALNHNMPFDQFTIQQLAGDLLETPTTDQLIATGFNRCHVTTAEGGSIEEEVYVRNVVDRVITTGTVFLGLTLECTSCHDHKYDPLTQKDFYSLFAFFNSIDGKPLDGNKKDHEPVLRIPAPEQSEKIERLEGELADTRREIQRQIAEYQYVEPEATANQVAEPHDVVWIEDGPPQGARLQGGWQFVSAPHPVYRGKKSTTRVAQGLSQHFFEGAAQPLEVGDGDRLFAHVYIDPADPPRQIMLQWNDGTWNHRAYWGGNHIVWGQDNTPSRRRMGDLPAAGQWVRLEVAAADVGLAAGARINGWAFTQFDGKVYWDTAGIVTRGDQSRTKRSLAAWIDQRRTAQKSQLPDELKKIVQIDTDRRTAAQQKQLQDYYVQHVYADTREIFDPLHKRIGELQKQLSESKKKKTVTTQIFRERKQPRPAYILHRGEYDKRREEVSRATPAVLMAMPDGAPPNRLGLARWLVDPRNPLTARVTINRFWQQLFGSGIVKTAEDFGSQGEVPSHPQLLDWLAAQFIADGWDIKQTMKRLVMSATYRQASQFTPELVRRDPQNRLLARGPRYRLDAEMLRDQALAVSGLLVNQLGGPSVKPPQPDGLWFAVGYSRSNTVRFQADSGPQKVHRRTLYTFIKRTAPPPQMSTLDAPSRESCTVRRERTNTPLQALLLMNDPQFVEAAKALAARVMAEGGSSPPQRARQMFRSCTGRHPDEAELAELTSVYADHLAEYRSDVEAAQKLVSVGEFQPADKLDTAAWAAWTMTANLVLNLDEVITKQ